MVLMEQLCAYKAVAAVVSGCRWRSRNACESSQQALRESITLWVSLGKPVGPSGSISCEPVPAGQPGQDESTSIDESM